MENRKDADNLALVFSLLDLPEVTEKTSSFGVKITQNKRSLTLRIEKGSIAWEQFAQGCLLALKQKGVRKQLQQLRKQLHCEGRLLRSAVSKEGRSLRSELAN